MLNALAPPDDCYAGSGRYGEHGEILAVAEQADDPIAHDFLIVLTA